MKSPGRVLELTRRHPDVSRAAPAGAPSLAGVLGALAAGCAPPCLGDDLPEVDAGPLQASIEAALWEFADWISPHQVCIAHVKLVEGPMGRYNPVTRGIQLDPRADDVIGNLNHELCHGLQRQEDLEILDVWALDVALVDAPHRQRDDESFARWCQIGAPGLALSTNPAASAMRESAYPRWPSPLEERAVPAPLAVWESEDPGGWLPDQLIPGADDTLLVSVQRRGDSGAVTAISLASGEVVPHARFVEVEPAPDTPIPGGWTLGYAADDPELGWLATASCTLPDGSSGVSWLRRVDGNWQPILLGPEKASRTVIHSSTGAWGAWIEGPNVVWFAW